MNRRNRSGANVAMLAMAMMAMDPVLWDTPTVKEVKEEFKHECPICHKKHEGKHLCCTADCFRELVRRQRERAT